jgi:sentrin-specific protease 1
LNDVIINAYGALILERAERWQEQCKIATTSHSTGLNKGKSPARDAPLDVHYLSTFFFAKLQDPGYEKARLSRWTKKVRQTLFS